MPGLGKKTFTAGDVLIAGDVNNYLMDQTVMNFPTVAARSSAIPVPSTGMVTYVGDTGTDAATGATVANVPQMEAYTGAQWQSLDGLTLISSATISTGVSSVTVTGAFSATYDAYKIVVTGGATSVSNRPILYKLGSTVAGYNFGGIYTLYGAGTILTLNGSSAAQWDYCGTGQADGIGSEIDIINPFLTKRTYMRSYFSDGSGAGSVAGFLNDALSYTSFIVAPSSGTITGGTIAVYGYRRT